MPEPNLPQLLSEADRAFVVAAAGCGKTEAIARAVALSQGRRQLVLTHTHAGVGALRRRLHALRVPKDRFTVDTIAGWALRFGASYPGLSGLETSEPVGPQWAQVYGAASRLLDSRALKRVVLQSYGGIYVDEYQDCVSAQHDLVLKLASLLPCRVLGDPLQGIFDFGGQRLVNWQQDVDPNFQRLPDLITPWRWKDRNAPLGQWLTELRQALTLGEPIDFEAAPVTWMPAGPNAEWRACMNHLRESGSVVAMRQWPNNCHDLSRTLRGTFTSMEEMDCGTLLTAAERIEAGAGIERVMRCIRFAKECMTGLSDVTASLEVTLRRGDIPRVTSRCAYPELYRAVIAAAGEDSLLGVLPLLLAVRAEGEYLYRRELWDEMIRALKSHARLGSGTLRDAAWHVREITRRVGRREDARTVSRTLLIKGLEYDHAIVLKADELNTKNLYVALTRGRESVTLISPTSSMTFPVPSNLIT